MSLSGHGWKLLGGGKRKGREQTRANGLTIVHTETGEKNSEEEQIEWKNEGDEKRMEMQQVGTQRPEKSREQR